eukprot:TRINITY_DN61752_c0_g1_i1.p1 TRINITY_DN61752_c0_g1~~TRINITY_DN61752_c0_g1_i1.p1  ORF type:complete len:1137 (-),score=218.82 TRINITY_DN61752_c0_g1_i1:445-3855(-)
MLNFKNLHRTRRSSSSVSLDGEDDLLDGTSFEEKSIQDAWEAEKTRMNVSIGCKTSIIITLIALAYRSSNLAGSRTCTDYGGHLIDRPEEWMIYTEVAYLISSIGVFIYIFQKPGSRLWMYMVTVILLSCYVLLIAVPPWQMACEDLLKFAICYKDKEDELAKQLAFEWVNTLDCSLQGHTNAQLQMMWLLVTPRMLPSYGSMYYNWVWIFGLYGGATYYYRNHQVQTGTLYSLHDVLMSFILLILVNCIALQRKYYITKSQRSKFVHDLRERQVSCNMYHILEFMVPTHVIVPMLKSPGEVISTQINRASILFVLIVDFDQHARRLSPEHLLEFLNAQFGMFDRTCQWHGVTKIETVGEEYVASVGVVPGDVEEDERHGHGGILGRLVKVASEIMRQQTPDVQFKMGMHTGPIVAGVIGKKLPRFRLFGDTINTAARFMQKGERGKVQFGEATRQELPPWAKVQPMRTIEMKGKGSVTAYYLDHEACQVQMRPAHRSMKHVSFAATSFEDPEPRMRARSRGSSSAPHQASSSVLLAPADSDAAERHSQGQSQPLLLAASPEPGAVEMTAMSPGQGPAPEHIPTRERRPSALAKTISLNSVGRLSSEDIPRAESSSYIYDPEFQKVLDQMTRDSDKVDLLRRKRFSPEEEAKRKQWFHETAIIKKLADRLDKQEVVVCAVTAMEVLYLVATDVAGRRSEGPIQSRLGVYLACRVLTLAIMFGWRMLARQDRWIRKKPQRVQLCLLLSWMLIAQLLILSYDCLNVRHNFFKDTSNLTLESLTDHVTKEYDRRDLLPSLMIFPLYAVISTIHPLPFYSALAFAFQAVFVSAGPFRHFSKNIVFTDQGVILFALDSFVNAFFALSSDRAHRVRFRAMHTLKEMHGRINNILDTLMPPLVADQYRSLPLHSDAPTHFYSCATIAQSDLVGFTKLASTRPPREVVEFIGELFGLFDELTDKHDVYKVETVGDAYIAGQADFPLTSRNNPISVIRFGMDMVQATQAWSKRRGWSVNCRVGVHTGDCIGGFVGTGMQRYHLFGEMMNILEVLESTAPEGMVQVSRACKEAAERRIRSDGLPSQYVSFEMVSGDCLTTSKGEEHAFEEVDGYTFVVQGIMKILTWVGDGQGDLCADHWKGTKRH